MNTPERTAAFDIDRMLGEVAAQTGIRLDRNDPAFALVLLNRIVLERSTGRVLDGIRSALADFERASASVQTQAGTVIAKELRESVGAVKAEIRALTNGQSTTKLSRWVFACGLLGVAAVFGAGLSIGLMFGVR
jgi:hypothetical protein